MACHSATWNRCLYEQAKSTSQVEKKAQTCLYSQSPFWQLLQDYRRYTLNTSALVFSTYYRKLKEVQITPLISLRKKWQDAAACRTTNMLFHSSTDLTAQCQAWEAPCARAHRAVKTTFLLFHSTSPRHNYEFDSAVALFPFIIVLSKISCKPHNQAAAILQQEIVIISRIKWSDCRQREKARKTNAIVLLAIKVCKYLQLS